MSGNKASDPHVGRRLSIRCQNRYFGPVITSYSIHYTKLYELLAFYQPSQAIGPQIKRIVIDAGHGGKDPGAIGKLTREKNLTLALALKTGELIKKNMPGVEVIYTRKVV